MGRPTAEKMRRCTGFGNSRVEPSETASERPLLFTRCVFFSFFPNSFSHARLTIFTPFKRALRRRFHVARFPRVPPRNRRPESRRPRSAYLCRTCDNARVITPHASDITSANEFHCRLLHFSLLHYYCY